MNKGSFNHNPAAQFRARSLRAEMTAGERILWEHLRKQRIGVRFRNQVRIDNYFLDFYSAKARLCIEVDGEQHQHQAAYDGRRDDHLRKLGIETMRIPSIDLFDPTGDKQQEWVKRIQEVCNDRAGVISTPQPPSSLTNQSEEGGS